MKRKDAKLIAKQFMALPYTVQLQLTAPYLTDEMRRERAERSTPQDIEAFTVAFVRAHQQGKQDELFAAIKKAAECRL
jgi:hypothetical protein